MAERRDVLLIDLLLDGENPRLPEPNKGQRAVLQELAAHQGKKLLALAKDIEKHGLNPSDLPIVMPVGGGDAKTFCVLEGNRRLTALKALDNPDSVASAI